MLVRISVALTCALLLGVAACSGGSKAKQPEVIASPDAVTTVVSPVSTPGVLQTPKPATPSIASPVPTMPAASAADAAIAAAVKLVGGVQVPDGKACMAQTKPCILYGLDKDSPDRGIAVMGLGDPQGGGAMLVFGRQANGDWDFWYGTQQQSYHTTVLPAQMRVCADGTGVNVRQAPSETSTSLQLLPDGTIVTADTFVLTQAGTYGSKPGPLGNGWYNLSAPRSGYVRADFLSTLTQPNCDLRNALTKP